MTPTETVLTVTLVVVVVAALTTALARTLVASLVAFAAYSLGLAVVWLLLRAPDVGLTEAAVGAGVTTSLFLLVVRRTDPAALRAASRRVDGRALVVAVAVTGGLLVTIPALPAVGDPTAPAFGPVTEFYLADAGERGIDNVVTAVLVVYRGFDTFGEIAVVVAAAVATLAVLDREVLA